MIKSFSHKGLKDFFYDGTKKGIQPKHADRLELILDRLNAAADIKDMNYPGSGLHKLEPRSTDMEKAGLDGNCFRQLACHFQVLWR